MAGVWVFKNGVVRLEAPPQKQAAACGNKNKKELVHTPSGQIVTSHEVLQRLLRELGWERYYEDPGLVQFHRRGSIELISLPADFTRVTAVHMYDIVIKNRESFKVV